MESCATKLRRMERYAQVNMMCQSTTVDHMLLHESRPACQCMVLKYSVSYNYSGSPAGSVQRHMRAIGLTISRGNSANISHTINLEV